MNKYTVVIADDNTEYCRLLKEYTDLTDDIEVVGIANDGVAAVEMVDKLHPDMLLLDNDMPKLCGIGVLKSINNLEYKPKIMAVTNEISEDFASEACELGVSFELHKTVSIELILKRVRMLMSI